MVTRKRHEDWPDDSMGILRAEKPVRGPQIVSGKITHSENMGPAPEPPGHPQSIPRAPRDPWGVSDIETAQLPPRSATPHMVMPRFYIDETVMLQQIKKDVFEIERMNQSLRAPYEAGTQAGIYTDILQSGSVTWIAEAARLLTKARNYKRAYQEQHAHDDPEGA